MIYKPLHRKLKINNNKNTNSTININRRILYPWYAWTFIWFIFRSTIS